MDTLLVYSDVKPRNVQSSVAPIEERILHNDEDQNVDCSLRACIIITNKQTNKKHYY